MEVKVRTHDREDLTWKDGEREDCFDVFFFSFFFVFSVV